MAEHSDLSSVLSAPKPAATVQGTGAHLRDVGVTLFRRGTGTKIVEHVDLECRRGKTTCLIGPSGCGKTTLLRTVAGFQRASEGQVIFGGQEVSGPGRDRIMVFQTPVLFPWLTVEENVWFGLEGGKIGRRRKRKAEDRDRVMSGLDEVGLSGFASYFPYQLSGGMRQRLQIARAFVAAPQMLLLDEPFGALDAQTRLGMQQLLQTLCAAHKSTVLLVTHDVEEALILGDVVYVLGGTPGNVVKTLTVPFDHPRGITTVGLPEFGRVKADLLSALGYDRVQ